MVVGIKIQQAYPRIFSAGLDLKQLVSPDPIELALMWKRLQNVYLALYSTPLATVAAINVSNATEYPIYTEII